jgi:hypothetical protein
VSTMQAIRAHTRGGPEMLNLERIPVPVPAKDEALIEVHAASITYDELLWDESPQRFAMSTVSITCVVSARTRSSSGIPQASSTSSSTLLVAPRWLGPTTVSATAAD